jgi:hypothetical protein
MHKMNKDSLIELAATVGVEDTIGTKAELAACILDALVYGGKRGDKRDDKDSDKDGGDGDKEHDDDEASGDAEEGDKQSSSSDDSFRIVIQKPDLSKITLDVEQTDSIETVKALIHIVAGFQRRCQRLLYEGNDLDDWRSLESYNIASGTKLVLLLRLLGDGKRARAGGGAGDSDKGSLMATVLTEYEMKLNMLIGSDVPFVAQMCREMQLRRDHSEWFATKMGQLSTADVKDLRDKVHACTTTDQRIRFVVKGIFGGDIDKASRTEFSLKLLTRMRDGLLDSYVSLISAQRYMTSTGAYDWGMFTKDCDVLIESRIRAEGAAAAARANMDEA